MLTFSQSLTQKVRNMPSKKEQQKNYTDADIHECEIHFKSNGDSFRNLQGCFASIYNHLALSLVFG